MHNRLPGYVKKLNRQIIRSTHREELQDEEWEGENPYARKRTPQAQKKIAKAQKRKEGLQKIPKMDTPEEMNWKMKKRVPIFDRNNAKPKVGAKPNLKKAAKRSPRMK